MHRLLLLPMFMGIMFCALSAPVHAQRTDDNAIGDAEDAFGSSIGNETIGLYGARSVRGFSPTAAGNLRLEGMYFDQYAQLNPRMLSGSRVRVGMTALGYLFPAPTGIVDYTLAKPGDKPLLSLQTGAYGFGGYGVEMDVKLPISAQWGLALTASQVDEHYSDGSGTPVTRWSVLSHWQPTEHSNITFFSSVSRRRHEEPSPVVVTVDGYLPQKPRSNFAYGPEWLQKEYRYSNHGLVGKMAWNGGWTLSTSLVNSKREGLKTFSNVYVEQPSGLFAHTVYAGQNTNTDAISGELRLSKTWQRDASSHRVHASYRARNVQGAYGGETGIDLGVTPYATPIAEDHPLYATPRFHFGEKTTDEINHSMIGLGYEGRLHRNIEFNVGVVKHDYEKTIAMPSSDPVVSSDDPWLGYANGAYHFSKRLAAYAGHTQGLEESGTAPESAENRNQALPTIRTKQSDAGIRWQISDNIHWVIGYFDVQKPYFATDASGVYRILGDVRHQGIETSLSGALTDQFNVVIGGVFMNPEVTGDLVDSGVLGKLPVGKTKHNIRLYGQYRFKQWQGFSVNASYQWHSSMMANNLNTASAPSAGSFNLGARYQLETFGIPSSLRLQFNNITDVFDPAVYGGNAFGYSNRRNIQLYWVGDLYL